MNKKIISTHLYPIPSREELLGVLRKAAKPLNLNDIGMALKVKPEELDGMSKRLQAMERDAQLKLDKQGRYTLNNQEQFISGRVTSHREGYGFLIPDDGSDDLFLPEREMQKVLHGDKVAARVTGTDRRGRLEGSIVEVLERANTHVIGRLLQENGVWLVAPEDKRFSQDVIVAGSPGKAKAGQVVSIELTEQPSRYSQPMGKIVEVLGEIDDPGMEIEIAVRKFGVPHIFSAAAQAAAAKLPDKVRAADLKERVDLRDVPLVTIDGEDARDFDDAVYCEPIKVGRTKAHRLIVAIADVSHYVKPNDDLDVDALARSTSVYFPRRVIPMLPEKLSNGLCSLNPEVDRLTLVCDMVISNQGEISAYQFYPAVIHSAARFTYTEVAAILGNTKGPEAAKRGSLVTQLGDLYEVFKVLLAARQRRGAIEFETTETYIVSNAMGKIEKILPRTRNDAHRLIEECMLAANVCAANLLETYEHPGVFRIHAGPGAEKLTQLRNYLKPLGLFLSGGDSPTPHDYADLMQKIQGRPDTDLLQTMLLRSMQQAVYSPDNIGHFGLAYPAYAHFTSPIRRYPDLLTHRAIKAILAGKRYQPKGIDRSLLSTVMPGQRKAKPAAPIAAKVEKDKANNKAEKRDQQLEIWEALGLHCSANERRADEASRDVEAWLKCYFMKSRLGEVFTGTITGVTQFGIFVQLDDMFIEGLVHVTELGSDYFQFDEVRHELRGERTGMRYQITDKVKVQVTRVDLDARKIDLGVVTAQRPGKAYDKTESAAKARQTKGKSSGVSRYESTEYAAAGRQKNTAASKGAGARKQVAEPAARSERNARSAKATPAKSSGKKKVSLKASQKSRPAKKSRR